MRAGGLIGLGFEFLGIAGLFIALGIYLDGKFSGRGLILICFVIVGMAAGIYHMIRRAKSAAVETRPQKERKLTPEENLRKLDEMTRELESRQKRKSP
jgi:F0F1-type ATP synthase assembly protein I